MRFTEAAVDDLLDAFPLLRRAPARVPGVSRVEGTLAFSMAPLGKPLIEDAYTLRIEVPIDAANELPSVAETAGRIPATIDEHNPGGRFCLGSPLALRLMLGRAPSLIDFVDQCVVPFLYAASWRRFGNIGWPFGELSHFVAGLQDDYSQLLGLRSPGNIAGALDLLSERPRLANKHPCVCGCNRRLGRCPYRFTLMPLRAAGTRESFRVLARDYRARHRVAECPPPVG